MFRRKSNDSASDADPRADSPDEAGDSPSSTTGEPGGSGTELFDEARFSAAATENAPGPYDAGQVPEGTLNRVDMGSLQIAGFTDMQLHFETDPTKKRFVSVVAAYQDAALRLQPLAAPRSGGLWSEMRPQISASIEGAGGEVKEVEGPLGTELHAVVPAVTPSGEQVRQPVRLVGFDGPRWLLHGVFMGSAASDPAKSELFEDVFRQTVVVRGEQPMAPGEVIPIVLPPEAQQAHEAQQAQAGSADAREPGAAQ